MQAMIDVITLLILLVALVSGIRAGFFSSVGALAGLVAGGAAAPWVIPWVTSALTDTTWRGLVVLLGTAVLLTLGAWAGAAIGSFFRRGADRLRLRLLERLAGGFVGVVAGALAVTFAGTAIASAGIPGLSPAFASSAVLRTVDRLTPDPLQEAMARLHSDVFADTVLPAIQGPDVDLDAQPPAGEVDVDTPALSEASQSVARVSGLAAACGVRPTGSGFVVAEDRIVTNAHVVAGVENPMVELPGEPARDGRVVYFDPVDDIAVVAADVDARPLLLADSLSPGDPAVVQGYPHGGPFRAEPASVAAARPALVPDIYGENPAERSVYTLRAQVVPGNSGGPLLTEAGEVAGVVFARDQLREDVGYAMTLGELLPVLAAIETAAEPVSTGACTG